jgi:Sap, sulfolipid-1-addressing protein
MSSVLGALIPLALVVTISPLNIIPGILLLFTKRPLTNASLFLAGFVVGVAGVLVVLTVIADTVGLGSNSDPSPWVAALKILLGVGLIVAAVLKFRNRPRNSKDASMPSWMDSIVTYTPRKSARAGVALGALNPKNVAVGFAAAVVISTAKLSGLQVIVACGTYVCVGVLGVATPVVVAIALGDKAGPVLEGWKVWLTQNNATVMSSLFFVIGVLLVCQGAFSL